QRRLPKRGFTNIFKKQWIEVTLSTLENSFEAGDEITPETMHSRGVIAKGKRDIVVLGTGELTKALTVSAHRFTKGARQKIEAAGGTVNVITPHDKADGKQTLRTPQRAATLRKRLQRCFATEAVSIQLSAVSFVIIEPPDRLN